MKYLSPSARFFYLIPLLFIPSLVNATGGDIGVRSPGGVVVTETDQSPKSRVGTISFGAGQVAINGSTAIITITGGGGGGGGALQSFIDSDNGVSLSSFNLLSGQFLRSVSGSSATFTANPSSFTLYGSTGVVEVSGSTQTKIGGLVLIGSLRASSGVFIGDPDVKSFDSEISISGNKLFMKARPRSSTSDIPVLAISTYSSTLALFDIFYVNPEKMTYDGSNNITFKVPSMYVFTSFIPVRKQAGLPVVSMYSENDSSKKQLDFNFLGVSGSPQIDALGTSGDVSLHMGISLDLENDPDTRSQINVSSHGYVAIGKEYEPPTEFHVKGASSSFYNSNFGFNSSSSSTAFFISTNTLVGKVVFSVSTNAANGKALFDTTSSSYSVYIITQCWNGVCYGMPSAQASAGQFLSNNGSGILSWATSAGGSGAGDNLGSHKSTQGIDASQFALSIASSVSIGTGLPTGLFTVTTGTGLYRSVIVAFSTGGGTDITQRTFEHNATSTVFRHNFEATGTGTFGGASSGTSTIAYGLTVNNYADKTAISDFTVKSSSDNNQLYVSARDGEVGINTNSPSSELDIVNGSITVRGTNSGIEASSYTVKGNPIFKSTAAFASNNCGGAFLFFTTGTITSAATVNRTNTSMGMTTICGAVCSQVGFNGAALNSIAADLSSLPTTLKITNGSVTTTEDFSCIVAGIP